MTPYYNRITAEGTAKMLEKLLENPSEPLVVQHEVLRISRRSLQNRLYNSLSYLCDKMDPDGIWKELRSRLRFSIVYNGVKVEMINRDLTGALTSYQQGNSTDLIGRIAQFLEDPKSMRFEEVNIKISEELVQAIKELIADLSVISIVRLDRVKIIKDVAQK